MKITNYLVLLALLALTACGGNDTKLEVTEEGTWTMEEITVHNESISEITSSPDETPIITSAIMDMQGENIDYEITLNGGEFTAQGSYDFTGDLTLTNSLLGADGEIKESFSQSLKNISGQGTYTIENNQFISETGFFNLDVNNSPIEREAIPTPATIEKLTESEMILSVDFEEVLDQSLDAETSIIARVIIQMEVKLKRK